MKWENIKKGSIIEMNSRINGILIIRVTSRSKNLGHGRIIVGRKKYDRGSNFYMFNRNSFNVGKIKILDKKFAKLLYGLK